jgi:transposase InsO family protein
MVHRGLAGRRRRRRRKTTVAAPGAEATVVDVIGRHFGPSTSPQRPLVRRHRLHRHLGGLAYLAAVIGLASRKVAGWVDQVRTDLVAAGSAQVLASWPGH